MINSHSRISSPLLNKRGEGYINTGMKVIIAVVIGALILGGIYMLFSNDGGVLSQMEDSVDGMMDYSGGKAGVRMKDESVYAKDMQYSVDGIKWRSVQIAECEDGATIEDYASHGNVHCAVMRDSTGVHIISSLDNGATWEKRRTWSSDLEVDVSWHESSNTFRGGYGNHNYYQGLKSSDGVMWKEDGPSWDLNW